MYPAFSEAISDGSALALVSRRLYELRNQLGRIQRLEGKPIDYLDERQEALVRSKPLICACINELEKLHRDLASAADQQASSPNSNSDHSGENTNSNSDHSGESTNLWGTENSGPSQADQQNVGISLPSRMVLVVDWRVRYYNYLLKNRRLLEEQEIVLQKFREINFSGEALLRRAKLKNKIDLVDGDSDPDQNDENSFSDQQSEGISWPLRVATLEQHFNATRNKQWVGVDWKRCCQELKEENLGLQRDVKLLNNMFIEWQELKKKYPRLLNDSPDNFFVG